MTKLATIGVIAGATVLLIGYDIFIVIETSPGDTISEVALAFGSRYPVVAWLWGGLAAHLFWPMLRVGHNVLPIPWVALTVPFGVYKWWALAAFILLTIVLGVLSFTGILPAMNPIVPLIASIPAGHWGWPQTREHGTLRWG